MPTLFSSFPNAGVVNFNGVELGITEAGWELECDMDTVPLQYEELGDYAKGLYYKGFRLFFSAVLRYASQSVMSLYLGGNLNFSMKPGDEMGDQVGGSLSFTPKQSGRLGISAAKAIPMPDGSVNLQNQALVNIPIRFEIMYIDDSTPMIEITGGAT